MNILVVDNYDSFTYNLVQYLGQLGCSVEVYRNDEIGLSDIQEKAPDRIVISPGPGVPKDAGISLSLVKEFAGEIPILGVCLGHQVIGEAFGGTVVEATELMHGKISRIYHEQDSILAGLPSPFEATRYHSLVLNRQDLPEFLLINAWTNGDVIMGVRHSEYAIFGVQFHPESVMTPEGMKILENFLGLLESTIKH